jgi:ferric-dicitrate binding protein FerR (iron transport regulator)
VVDVPSRPAYVRPPGAAEQPARRGQRLATKTLLRTKKPGRLQVRLADGRSFRLGGDSLLEIGPQGIDLLRGQIIAWVNPGQKVAAPLRIRTRVATASIMGTTVFIESSTEKVSFLSWEGAVEVDTDQGKRFTLRSGDQMAKVGDTWQLPRPLPRAERTQRRRRSPLLNGFTAPMETLPVLEQELGLRP